MMGGMLSDVYLETQQRQFHRFLQVEQDCINMFPKNVTILNTYLAIFAYPRNTLSIVSFSGTPPTHDRNLALLPLSSFSSSHLQETASPPLNSL